MNKFNGHEAHIISEALDLYVKEINKEIEKTGRSSIFAPGFYSRFADELIDKIQKDMTKKDKWQ